VDNDNVQGTQAQAQGNAAPVEICYLPQRKKRSLSALERFWERKSAETWVSSRFFFFFSSMYMPY
jgi:hypothetical protein